MAGLTAGGAINTLVMIAFAAGAAWQGHRRRRAFWSRASWIRFGLTMLVGFALIGFSLYFSAAVGQPWTGARGSGTRAAWIVLAVACLVGGPLLTAFSLMWFAEGDPTKPFTLLRFTRTVRAVVRGSERVSLFTRAPAGADKERALREPPPR